MRHDVFINPAPRSRSAFPPIAVLQADIAEGRNRMIAPMAPRAAMPAAIGRLMPVVRHDGRDYLLAIELMVSIPPNDLRHAAGDMPSASPIPSFHTTSNIPLNERDCETVSAKRAISGDSLCSGMVGISS